MVLDTGVSAQMDQATTILEQGKFPTKRTQTITLKLQTPPTKNDLYSIWSTDRDEVLFGLTLIHFVSYY